MYDIIITSIFLYFTHLYNTSKLSKFQGVNMSDFIIDRIIAMYIELSEHEKLRVTVIESGKSAVLIGSFALLGGLVGGRVGLGVGGAIGAAATAYRSIGNYKSVVHVLMYDMTPEQRKELAFSLIRTFGNVKTMVLLQLLSQVMIDTKLKTKALNVLKRFLVSNGYVF